MLLIFYVEHTGYVKHYFVSRASMDPPWLGLWKNAKNEGSQKARKHFS